MAAAAEVSIAGRGSSLFDVRLAQVFPAVDNSHLRLPSRGVTEFLAVDSMTAAETVDTLAPQTLHGLRDSSQALVAV